MKCDECGEPALDKYDICKQCCSHDDMEEAFCLICGEDLTEELSAKAYDAYKDRIYDSYFEEDFPPGAA